MRDQVANRVYPHPSAAPDWRAQLAPWPRRLAAGAGVGAAVIALMELVGSLAGWTFAPLPQVTAGVLAAVLAVVYLAHD